MFRQPKNLDDAKIRARLLLKSLRRSDPDAVARFQALRSLAPSRIQLKHALTVIALEAGHDSWASLKRALTDSTERLYPREPGGFLNAWFSRYDDARACREAQGGFLFPYRSQFFVATASFVKDALELSPDDADWARIGWDWERPKDQAAWQRLSARLGS
ncbi:MAG: hypothetical protein JST54_29295 [Deltaproteobacteria bacterium]|nr:hypothetical protein [Deltaproteobacteria bacterium]